MSAAAERFDSEIQGVARGLHAAALFRAGAKAVQIRIHVPGGLRIHELSD